MQGIGLHGIGLIPPIMKGVAYHPIYGASWPGGASPILTRTDQAVGKIANAGVDAGAVVNDFDSIYPWSAMTENTDALGNVFIRIPRFYIEKTAVGAARTWRISASPFGSAYLPACFAPDKLYVDVGKYNASLSGANKLESKSGTYPLINKNIVEFRGYAQANGAGYQQMDIHVVDLLSTLFYIEFATLNSQAIMAGWTAGTMDAGNVATATEAAANRIVVANAAAALFVVGQAISCGAGVWDISKFYGRTITSIIVVDGSNKALNFDGAAVDIVAGNTVWSSGWKSGFSASIVAKSGSPTHLTNGLFPCMYRGIENPWGSVWQFVDGININDRQAWVCPTPTSYASNLFAAPYEALSYVNYNANDWVSAMGFDPSHPYANLPTAGAGGGNYYSDYYYQDVGQRIALVGGGWADGTAAGLSCWLLYYASSATGISFGGRLLRTAL
jgi:hypothetical protein